MRLRKVQPNEFNKKKKKRCKAEGEESKSRVVRGGGVK
jgi:hypothetical protein